MRDDATTWTVTTDKSVYLNLHNLRVEVLRGPLEGNAFELSGSEGHDRNKGWVPIAYLYSPKEQ